MNFNSQILKSHKNSQKSKNVAKFGVSADGVVSLLHRCKSFIAASDNDELMDMHYNILHEQ